MKTKHSKMPVLLVLGILCSGSVLAQVSTAANNSIFSATDFVGWDNTVTNDPLQIKHEANQPIEWYTNNARRMRLRETLTGQTIGTYTGLDLSGHLGIGLFGNNIVNRPFSLLHIDDGGNQFSGYRPWHKTGVTLTRGSDLGYVGLKDEGNNLTSMTVCWADNTNFQGPDLLKFVFLAQPIAASGTAGSLDGLEAARIRPAVGGNESFFGIGDWFTTGGNANPTERLHLLDGRLRLEGLPDDDATTDDYLVMVVDNTTDPGERGVVKWVDPNDLPGGTVDCDWTMNATTPNHVFTAVGGADPDCPDGAEAVGIGVDLGSVVPVAKLHLSTQEYNSGADVVSQRPNADAQGNRGVQVKVSGNQAMNFGFHANVTQPSTRSCGIFTETDGASFSAWGGQFNTYDDARFTWGAQGTVYGGVIEGIGTFGWSRSSGMRNIGAKGRAFASATEGQEEQYIGVWGEASVASPNQVAYGVYGEAPIQANSWAGFFKGDVNVTGIGVIPGGVWTASDENLKTNIEELNDALEVITQLNPRAYNYQVEAFPHVGLPVGLQYGFLAQELEQVIPGSVKDVTFQAELDSTGQQVHPAVSSKIVNTDMLIPFLVAAVKEQQATIEELRVLITQCCAAHEAMPQQTGEENAAPSKGLLQEQRLLIIPNPVANLTQLEYYVHKPGKVSLQVSTSDGKAMATLREEMAQEGMHTYTWNTTDLAAGTYFCTYMLDDAVVVKRAIKVQ